MKVHHYRSINKNMIIGTFSLLLKSGIIIYDCTLIEKSDGSKFVSMPQKKYLQDDGRTKYLSYIGFENSETRKVFLNEALDTVKKFLVEHPEARFGGKKNAYQNDTNEAIRDDQADF